jgi:hypothetical protein
VQMIELLSACFAAFGLGNHGLALWTRRQMLAHLALEVLSSAVRALAL